ncbi:UvrD-helicase domain-containing protein [Limibacterium fermenti]|uniref:UvrD-helicase domain-containing protein n=1 Tax=Limibacterium fermenti TaxID=3229863 RepID=UPI003A6705F1
MATSITSDDLIPIEQHFRVSAGPGAGKTHWLINHIKNVLYTSSRLYKTRKVACITYTNIAVETILTRLGSSSDRVEVTTIHSFLYKHIVKPYVKFIADDYELNVNRIDGHDEVTISRGRIINWVTNHPKASSLSHPYTVNQLTRLEDNIAALTNWLSKVSFTFNSTDNLVISCDRKYAYSNEANRRYLNKRCLDLLETDLISLKKEYWKRGILHHDDVLFFSYQLLVRYPFILTILRAKFPYFYIDEFQDSNPIQVRILKMIGQVETRVGIIGDKAQSIYGFQGADASQFEAFRLDGMTDYQMLDNRRSTNQIIDCLNLIRPGFMQNKVNDMNGEIPHIIVGNTKSALNKGKELCSSDIIHSLSYKNITSNAIKKEMDVNVPTNNLFKSLSEKDSNKERQSLVSACIKATEYAMHNRFKEALKEFEKILSNKDTARKEALKHLTLLVSRYYEYSNGSLLDFHAFVSTNIKAVSALRAGGIQDFYMNNTYKQLAVCVNIIEDNSLHRTIHKSKGDEFDNVMLVVDKEADLSFLFSPNLDNNEDHRVFYVAMSRAKNRLFISTPTLSAANRAKVAVMPFAIHDLP